MDKREVNLQLAKAIAPYLTALPFVTGTEATGYRAIANATAAFVDTGKTKLLVTSAHVVHSFDDKAQLDCQLRMRVGGGVDRSASQIIEREWLKSCSARESMRVDLATFVLPDELDISVFGKRFYRHPSWPPSRVQTAQVVVIGGYPSDHIRPGSNGISASLTTVADSVSFGVGGFVCSCRRKQGTRTSAI